MINAKNRSELDTLQISDIRLTAGPTPDVFELCFDISWEASWRFEGQGLEDPSLEDRTSGDRQPTGTWDAAWVFFKLRRVRTVAATDEMTLALGASDPSRVRRLLQSQQLPVGPELKITPDGDSWLVESTITQKPFKPGIAQEQEQVTYRIRRGEQDSSAQSGNAWEPGRIIDVTHKPPRATVARGDGGRGVFVHRGPGHTGFGDVSFKDVRLRFCLPKNHAPRVEDLAVAVFGLEMVYIPQGPFWAGDLHRNVDQAFYDSCTPGNNANLAYYIDSEEPLEVAGDCTGCPSDARRLFYQSVAPLRTGGDQKGPIPAAFPKGYRAFYVMKSHVTQGQYADFVNFIPTTGKTQRYPYEEGAYRYTIARDRSMKRTARRPRRACNFLAWADGIAYAAWACLRPMTELEFEKACRGSEQPVTQEFAWGNTDLQPAQIIIGPGTTEISVSGNCNVDNTFILFNGGDGSSGPVRDDAFVVAGSPDLQTHRATDTSVFGALRTTTGASYYGVLGLSGNVWEQCVTVGNPEGRAFTGKHGEGQVTPAGSAPAAELEWPGDVGVGAGFRGGSWFTDSGKARVADRNYAAGLRGFFFRALDTGFRCAATAPEDDS